MQHQKTSTFVAARRNATRQATLTGTVQLLWPYIWPTDRSDLKLRVFLAVALMLLSKLFTIAIPYSYKWATDAVANKLALDAVPLPHVLVGAAAQINAAISRGESSSRLFLTGNYAAA